jgi:hypothetical protein
MSSASLPLVSVCIPAYDRARFVGCAIQSVLAQMSCETCFCADDFLDLACLERYARGMVALVSKSILSHALASAVALRFLEASSQGHIPADFFLRA